MQKDREIILKLMEDPRASFTQIAKEIGSSTEAVRQRVKKLRSEGKLKLYVAVNAKEFNKRRCTFILNVPLAKKISVLQKLKSLPITLEIHAGVLSNILIMDITTDDPDRDTHELHDTFEKMGVEVKEVFESELAYFNSQGVIK
jgi:DNA-binding Lrp family transcriptional regulator